MRRSVHRICCFSPGGLVCSSVRRTIVSFFVNFKRMTRLVRLYIFDGLWAFTFQSCIHVQREQLDDVHTSPSKKSATYMSTCKLTFRAGCATFASSRLEGPTLWSDRSTWFVTSGKAKGTQIQVFSCPRKVTHALDDQCRRAYFPRYEARE